MSLSLPPGETVFVTGRSGVGKSLLLRTVAGLDAAQAGSVRLAGDPQGPRFAQGGGLPAWRCRVAYASQGRWPFAATPTETLADFASFAAQQAWALVAGPPLELQPLACALGLEPAVLGQRWATLSGGQAARAQLAVTLALRPRVLLLDEPTAGATGRRGAEDRQGLGNEWR